MMVLYMDLIWKLKYHLGLFIPIIVNECKNSIKGMFFMSNSFRAGLRLNELTI